VVALTGWRPGRTWSLLLAGMAALVIADTAYTLQTIDGGPAGGWIDAVYVVGAILLAAAVWQPAAAAQITSAGGQGRRELIVPALFAGVMIGLFGMQYYSSTSSLSTALWAGTMVAVIVRLAMSDRENKTLLEQVQTDPLTGLANRGRMQVDLERRCAEAKAEQPTSLLFLDLNGFKHYNDTLGHPAGDQLLIALGAALSDSIGEDGVAYRVGGDEFCVLLTCAEDRFYEVTRKAATALRAQGKGFAVSAAWGAAAIPREATTPSEALQLADVRMYAQKESRRLALDDADVGAVKVTEWPEETSGAK
jgi:diguanylate cyclase (GGDEF)-like protein